MKWILILIWTNDGAAISGQYGPFLDKPNCETVRKQLTDMTFSGTIRAACALSGIDPRLLPQIETNNAPKKVVVEQHSK